MEQQQQHRDDDKEIQLCSKMAQMLLLRASKKDNHITSVDDSVGDKNDITSSLLSSQEGEEGMT
eukprot:11108307-Ditylum_brightwellii.AAC.1